MGGSSSQTTNQSFNQNSVMTPTNPEFVSRGLGNIGGTIDRLNGQDPFSFIAGPDALQTQAGTNASGLTGTPWAYDGATDLARGVGQMDSPDIASLMAPFKGAFDKRVISPVMAALDQSDALNNAQGALARANDTTFGGSGGAIMDALTRGQEQLARGQTLGGLLSDQFKTALGGAESQAGVNQNQQALRLNAAGQLDTTANDFSGTQRANADTQAQIGSILQQLAQARAGAPLTVAGSLSSDYGTLPLGLLHGFNSNTSGTSTGTTTGSQFGLSGGDLGNMAMAAAMFFSDRRLKRDIVKVGERPDGLGLYLYRYLWSPVVHLGVMAQEVLGVKPEAVVVHPSGYLAVDYGKL